MYIDEKTWPDSSKRGRAWFSGCLNRRHMSKPRPLGLNSIGLDEAAMAAALKPYTVPDASDLEELLKKKYHVPREIVTSADQGWMMSPAVRRAKVCPGFPRTSVLMHVAIIFSFLSLWMVVGAGAAATFCSVWRDV